MTLQIVVGDLQLGDEKVKLNHMVYIYIYTYSYIFIEGSLNSKLPTIWRVEKQMKSRWDEVKSEERRCNSAKVRRKKINPRQMLEKSWNAVLFQWFVCRVSWKVGSLKRRVRSHVVRGEMKNCTPLWRKAHFEVKMYKTRQLRTTFWSSDVEKLHAAVARSTFWSENVQNTSASDHFLKCRKFARRCGEKRILKWKCTKHVRFGPLFEVPMSKNCTPLWREAHFEVKMYKTRQLRTTFWNVENLHAAVARSAFWSENVQNLSGSDHFLKFRCRKIARRCGEKHICKSKCTKHVSFGPLFEMSKICTPLWREAHFEVKMYKTRQVRTTFWSSDVEKLHAAVARSAFWSENVQNTSASDHFLKCRKFARRCGEKRILKWKCTKPVRFGPLFEVPMSKNCTPLWREAHFEVKMLKNLCFGAHFEVQMSKN